MEIMFGFAGLVVMTLLALFAALVLQSALLHAMLWLIQPATADRVPVRVNVAHGAQLVVRALSARH